MSRIKNPELPEAQTLKDDIFGPTHQPVLPFFSWRTLHSGRLCVAVSYPHSFHPQMKTEEKTTSAGFPKREFSSAIFLSLPLVRLYLISWQSCVCFHCSSSPSQPFSTPSSFAVDLLSPHKSVVVCVCIMLNCTSMNLPMFTLILSKHEWKFYYWEYFTRRILFISSLACASKKVCQYCVLYLTSSKLLFKM